MDEILKKFLEEAKAKEKEAADLAAQKEKEERDAYLISLGLTSGMERKWSDNYSDLYVNWDNSKEKYYYDCPIPINVTDEEYALIKKYAPILKKSSLTDDDAQASDAAESTLNVINSIFLTVVIIGSVVLLFTALGFELYLNIVWALCLLIVGLCAWAFVKVYINISNNLHEINNKMGGTGTD